MNIAVTGYNSFKDVVTELGSPSSVFYSQTGGVVYAAVAVISATQSVSAKTSIGAVDTTQFLTDFPSAIEIAFGVEAS